MNSRNIRAEVRGNQLVVDLEDFLTDDIERELSKRAVYNERLLECLAKICVNGEVDWDDEEIPTGWRTWTSGREQAFERVRQTIAQICDDSTKKLVADLTKQRDDLYAKLESAKQEIFQLKAECDRINGAMDVLLQGYSDRMVRQ